MQGWCCVPGLCEKGYESYGGDREMAGDRTVGTNPRSAHTACFDSSSPSLPSTLPPNSLSITGLWVQGPQLAQAPQAFALPGPPAPPPEPVCVHLPLYPPQHVPPCVSYSVGASPGRKFRTLKSIQFGDPSE